MDANPFAADGAVAYEWGYEIDSPIYGKGGPTATKSQCSPQSLEYRKPTGGFPPHVMETVRRRAEVDIPFT
jgi:hypothetical protein